jgi:hypothetical protein
MSCLVGKGKGVNEPQEPAKNVTSCLTHHVHLALHLHVTELSTAHRLYDQTSGVEIS